MKFIGQFIQHFIARFRNDVFLENIADGTVANDKFLGLDSNNKIVKETITSGSGDITAVTIVTDNGAVAAASQTSGNATFTLVGSTGVGVTNSSELITVTAVPGEIDHDSLNNFVSAEHVDWAGASAGTIHSSNIPTLNQDTTGSAATLTSAREFRTDLSSTSTASFDGSANASPGVTGTLAIGNGGTGNTSGSAATLTTPRAINGVNFDGSAAITIPTRVHGSTIKVLPTDFIPNEDGGTSKGVFLDDDGTTGLKAGIAQMELIAVVIIPENYKATHVDIFDNSHNLVVNVFEMNVNASGQTSKGSGNANTTIDITDVNATATNYLAIEVVTTATSERVFGGTVTIAPQ